MKFINFSESIQKIYDLNLIPLLSEKVFLSQSLGRVLSKDIKANYDSPQFPTSAMDGYALRFEDQDDDIKVIDQMPAGTFKEIAIFKDECVKTFTGSLVCQNADVIVPIENVQTQENYIRVNELQKVKLGANIRPVGENFKKNEILIEKGTKIGFAQIGVMASLNISQVDVVRRPKVAVLATGSEVLDVGEEEQNLSQIRSSNHFTIEAIAKEAGAEVLRLGTIGDDRQNIEKLIYDAFETCDILVSTGGVSVGDFDFVKEIIAKFDANPLLDGVKMKPGQHIKAVEKGGKFFFALPGFPYSSAVTFFVYCVALLRKMQGLESQHQYFKGILRQPYEKKSNKTEFVAANLTYENGNFYLDFEGKRNGSSAILTNMLNNPVLMVLDENDGDKLAGDSVKFISFKNGF